jgi:hypothetical protein
MPLSIYLAEVLHGFSSCTLGPAIAALSLMIAGSSPLERGSAATVSRHDMGDCAQADPFFFSLLWSQGGAHGQT